MIIALTYYRCKTCNYMTPVLIFTALGQAIHSVDSSSLCTSLLAHLPLSFITSRSKTSVINQLVVYQNKVDTTAELWCNGRMPGRG